MGYAPSASDLARRLHATEDEIVQAQEVSQAYRLVSLDVVFATDAPHKDRSLGEYVGAADAHLANFEDTAVLQDAIDTLNRQERAVVYWRFYESLPQAEIAKRLNVSQMRVSRMQSKALKKMRHLLLN